mgnify:FL=1|tara:strand:- start:257 stop:523 length:267 start_codon:yes stop_codon:yes gene_type:complete
MSFHLNQSNIPKFYYNKELASVGDIVKYHNIVDLDHDEDEEIYLVYSIDEYFVGSDGGSDCKVWLATIGNNHGRQIINICYLVKVKGE